MFTTMKLTIFNTPIISPILRLLSNSLMRLAGWRVEGTLPNLPKYVIIGAPHTSNWDFLLFLGVIFLLKADVRYMGKAELFKNPIMDLALRNLSAFPVTRGDKDMWAMRHASKILKQGQWLGMFPEGTRSKGKGLTVAKTGTARMAIEAGCPILPMAIIGTDKFFKKFPRRAQVNVSILPPLMPMENESPLALTDRLMFTLAQALPVSMRGVYASLPEGFG